jgi:predicted lipid-binding transport protein (Tim44 family)
MKIKKYITTILLLIFFGAGFYNFTIKESDARPGGGSSFRSSRGSSGSSFKGSSSFGSRRSSSGRYHYSTNVSGSTFALIFFIILFIIILFICIVASSRNKPQVIISNNSVGKKRTKQKINDDIENLKKRDPDFSRIVFLDFVNSLYHKFYFYHGKPEITNLTPFISETLLKTASANTGINISEVVIGSIDLISVSEQADYDVITVEIDANYALLNKGTNLRYLVFESWKFCRKKGAISKTPEKMRSLSCPNCGGATNFNDAGECGYCHTFIKREEMQWTLGERIEIEKSQFSIDGLGSSVPETGTELQTIKENNLSNKIISFQQLYSISDWDKYWQGFTNNFVSPAFIRIYKSWSENKLADARFLLSDRLYESFKFWIDTYKRANLVNKLENIKIQKIELVKIETDKYYDVFTVRIFASCFDYMQNINNNQIVGGSDKKERKYSEYWTFFRKAGRDFSETTYDFKSCPSCGAGIDKIGQGAECSYCGSKISTGDFSWVLALITQDEVYTG